MLLTDCCVQALVPSTGHYWCSNSLGRQRQTVNSHLNGEYFFSFFLSSILIKRSWSLFQLYAWHYLVKWGGFYLSYSSLKLYVKAWIVESTITSTAGKDIKYCTANHRENMAYRTALCSLHSCCHLLCCFQERQMWIDWQHLSLREAKLYLMSMVLKIP